MTAANLLYVIADRATPRVSSGGVRTHRWTYAVRGPDLDRTLRALWRERAGADQASKA
ncbi:hypothetical protein [Jiangella asiatica]|uniref:hypothetical protein n=1 Tax=Jiangella asiatica TaxID=2530372 RepID=UPI0013A5C66F|nr:hypothetical protein [Jiangella asiatica]